MKFDLYIVKAKLPCLALSKKWEKCIWEARQ